MPDIKFKTRDEIPESLREEAREVEGQFVVGVVHESFRQKNIDLLKARDALQIKVTTYEGLVGEDPEKFATEITGLRTLAQRVKDGELKGNDKVEAEVVSRSAVKIAAAEAKNTALEASLAAEKAAGASYKDKFQRSVVDNAIIAAVMAADSPANPAALTDILQRGKEVFKAQDDGSVVAMKGETIWYDASGDRSIKPNEWLKEVVKEAAYLGKTSGGGGAPGGSGKGKGGMSDEAFQKLTPMQRVTMARR